MKPLSGQRQLVLAVSATAMSGLTVLLVELAGRIDDTRLEFFLMILLFPLGPALLISGILMALNVVRVTTRAVFGRHPWVIGRRYAIAAWISSMTLVCAMAMYSGSRLL